MKSVNLLCVAVFLFFVSGCTSTNETEHSPHLRNSTNEPALDYESVMGRTFPPEELDSIPKPIQRPAPRYPEEFAGSGIVGKVRVSFIVMETGVTNFIRILESDHSEFEESVIRAVRFWRFTPAMKNGEPVPCPVQIQLEINESSEPANKQQQ